MAEQGMEEFRSSSSYAPQDISEKLGPLGELAGTWEGTGFDLLARPDYHDKTDLYLQLNQTQEHVKFEPMGEPSHLAGLSYVHAIAGKGWDGGSHIEPGIWVIEPPTRGRQVVGRLASIQQHNAVLAEGCVTPFTGVPVRTVAGGAQYNGSLFPSFNTTPFAVPPSARALVFHAAGTSEKIAGPRAAISQRIPFPMYDLSVPPGPIAPNQSFGGVIYNPQPPLPQVRSFTLNTRTPYHAARTDAQLPAEINGVPIQDLVNDPILLLQRTNEGLVRDGCRFEGFAFNIASVRSLRFLKTANSAPLPAGEAWPPVSIPEFDDGLENSSLLRGMRLPHSTPAPDQLEENAQTAVVYATFWLSRVTRENPDDSFMQLQYAQMAVLNFPILSLLSAPGSTYVNLGWPHVSVATLRKCCE